MPRCALSYIGRTARKEVPDPLRHRPRQRLILDHPPLCVARLPPRTHLGVREAFFVSFMGNLGVPADRAFACGFLFFIMTILLAAPGLAVILWENVFDRRTPVLRSG